MSEKESSVSPSVKRLGSLDAYRGLVMLAIASHGLGIAHAARNFPDSSLWKWLARQFEHVPWRGAAAWDMIQPSFMFMVGVAMAYSYAKRRLRGDSHFRLAGHALSRSLILIAMGVFLASNWSNRTNFIFTNVLAQIGLGYFFLFLLWNRKPKWQLTAAGTILFATWLAFALYPTPGEDFNYSKVGLEKNWPHLEGFAAHWEKNTNIAAAFDRWFLNLFPREKPFVFNRGGYTTLNFVPSIATMLFGLLAGGLLRSERRKREKVLILAAAGAGGVALGLLIDALGVCPIVKRIWTPSWALLSGGWALLILAFFYGLVDAFPSPAVKRAAGAAVFPLVVVGMNSIAMYFMAQLIHGWTRKTLRTHLGQDYASVLGAAYSPIVEAAATAFVLWLICLWLYRRRIFIRV